jgi:hypothetical protein
MRTIGDLADALSTTVRPRPEALSTEQMEQLDHAEQEAGWPIVKQFFEAYVERLRAMRCRADPDSLRDAPKPTGSARWDALCAAITETIYERTSSPPPDWVHDPARVLDRWWFPARFESHHAEALVMSPGPFAIRGIFVNTRALELL